MTRWALRLAVIASLLGAISVWAVVLGMAPRIRARKVSNGLVDRAQQLSSQGESFASRLLVDQALAADESNPRARRELAMHLVARGHRERALEEMRRVAAAQPDDSGAARELAYLLWEMDDREAAIDWLREAMRREPHNGQTYVDLAHCLLATEDVSGALHVAEEAAARYPRPRFAFRVLGLARWRSGDLAGAREAFDESLRLRPREVATLLAAADVLEELGLRDDAIGYARRAVTADPQSALAWFVLGQLLAAAGQEVEAREALARARSLSAAQSSTNSETGKETGPAPSRGDTSPAK
jgi:tetratricopeptide (TPR) repeat protein